MSLRDRLIESGALSPKGEPAPTGQAKPPKPEAGRKTKPPLAWKKRTYRTFLLKLAYLFLGWMIASLRFAMTMVKWALIKSGPCGYCGKYMTAKELTMDHIVPVSKGGQWKIGNVIPCCKTCNQSKGNTNLESWRKTVNAGNPFYFEDGNRHFFSVPPKVEKIVKKTKPKSWYN